MNHTYAYRESSLPGAHPEKETEDENRDDLDHTGEFQTQLERLKNATIMMVDDEPTTTDVLTAFLEDAGYWNFVATDRSAEAIDLLEATWPDVLLLDLMMPDVSGFDILTAMRADDKLKHVPVIVLTSSTDADTKLKALELGATDFLSKPVDPSELVLRLRNTLTAKAYQDQLAYYDPLTGLPNRRMFMERMDWQLKNAKRDDQKVALLYLGLDRFKQINDSFGLRGGDILLKQVAQRLEQSIRESDYISRSAPGEAWTNLSRLGGDEFSLLLHGIQRVENAALVARRIISALAEPFHLEGNEVFVTPSIGIAGYPNDATERDLLLKQAVGAMDYAKQKGRNTYKFYSKQIDANCLEQLTMQNQLRKALDNGELLLHYQPEMDLESGRVIGAESLLRWNHPSLGTVPPNKFIPLMEELGLIGPVGEWVIHEACRQNKAWQSAGLDPIKIAANVSAQQFRQQNFASALQEALKTSGLDPRFLALELTESIIMGNAERNIDVLHEIKEMGVTLAVDDFGTGYSSLAYLRKFPLDELKIDRSFLTDIHTNSDDATIVEAIIGMAHTLGLSVVAEGVETEDQLTFLRQKGCDRGQGYLIGKPFPAEDFCSMFLQHNTVED
jgi:diguanylate cyclase (GGDEF)-like protein